MADFTYDPSTDRGWVRLKLADTKPGTAVFDDAEIDAFLARGGSVEAAIYLGAEAALAQATRGAGSRTMSGPGGTKSVDTTSRMEGWRALMAEYAAYAPGRKARVRYDGGRRWDRRSSR